MVSSLGFAVMTRLLMADWWYLRPNRPESLTNPTNPLYAWVIHLITALLLYGYLIPISLYVSIELVKVLQATFINQDLQIEVELAAAKQMAMDLEEQGDEITNLPMTTKVRTQRYTKLASRTSSDFELETDRKQTTDMFEDNRLMDDK
ncbi:hypothetical protein Bca52824_017004 [Brassica carinata]|uniref:Phospholipid-transporting ATPase n=1 Tax=Brassica carinata TaxID=52824 RepID=A0A8X8AWT6_BRACI|nr:hypothetical protein Bca52824_017004 [Brassica carinata]